MLRVCIIGLGHLGKWHAEKACKFSELGVKLTCAVDHGPNSAQVLKDRDIDVPIFHDVRECLDQFDAAFIVTPTHTHFEITKILLNESKHVFCEKPMTETYREACEIKELVDTNNVIYQVGHSERFHKVWKDKTKYECYLSAPAIFNFNRLAPFKGRATDVDVSQDLMIHDIDLLLHLYSSKKPVSVKAFGLKQRTDKNDFVQASFSYDNGSVAHIRVGRNHINEQRSFNVTNSNGSFEVDLFNKVVLEAPSSAQDNFVTQSSYEGRDHLLVEHEYFYKSILEKAPIAVTVNDGLSAIYYLEKVSESLLSSKEVSC